VSDAPPHRPRDASDAPLPPLHPAQNRGLREAYATARHLERHWSSLAGRVSSQEAVVLRGGVVAAESLVAELEPAAGSRGLAFQPAARSLGRGLAGARAELVDRALERNQALRWALLEAQHLVTLLRYQAAVADSRGDAELSALCARHADGIAEVAGAAAQLVEDLGRRPDEAVAPLVADRTGDVGHRMATAIGSLGEWLDRQLGRRP
jgi:hypothetical protein